MMERRYQVNYHNGEENVVLVTDSSIQSIKRTLSKKRIVGSASIFDRKEDKVTYYKPRYHHRNE